MREPSRRAPSLASAGRGGGPRRGQDTTWRAEYGALAGDYALKEIVPLAAVVSARGHAAVPETDDRSRRGTGRCGPVSRAVPCCRSRSARLALRASRRDNPSYACWSVRNQNSSSCLRVAMVHLHILDRVERGTAIPWNGKWASIPQPTGCSLSLSSLSYSRPATTQPIFKMPATRNAGTSRSAPEPSRNARTRRLPFTLRTEGIRTASSTESVPSSRTLVPEVPVCGCALLVRAVLRPHDRRSFRRSVPRGMGEACVNRPLPARERRTSRFGALAGVIVTDITLPDAECASWRDAKHVSASLAR